jgi:curved DNA-binding protein CbpA
MNDYFATLGVERRPWLDAEELKDSFRRQAAEVHPDALGPGGRPVGEKSSFVDLNLAHRILRDPGLRLGHLLELEAVVSEGGEGGVDGELGALFMEVGGLSREVRLHVGRRNTVSSGLEKALIASETASLIERMERLSAAVEARWGNALEDLRELDARWGRERDQETVRNLALLRRRFAVLTRWREQVGECLFSLKTG